jgi:uncharacterized protein YndB with AHSA1/START domain
MSQQKNTDRVEKEIQLPNTRDRVWRALTESRQFGEWFGVKFNEPFKAGTPIKGALTIKGYEHLTMEFIIDAIVPESRFSFHWHPYAIDPNVDYSKEPMTLVEFTLESVDGGTLLKVVETGFDKIPASRRVKAFEMNTSGWASQMKNIAKYLAAQS